MCEPCAWDRLASRGFRAFAFLAFLALLQAVPAPVLRGRGSVPGSAVWATRCFEDAASTRLLRGDCFAGFAASKMLLQEGCFEKATSKMMLLRRWRLSEEAVREACSIAQFILMFVSIYLSQCGPGRPTSGLEALLRNTGHIERVMGEIGLKDRRGPPGGICAGLEWRS